MVRSQTHKPLLCVDVDGVISLFGFEPSAPPAGDFRSVDGIVHLLSATAGDHLRSLTSDFELIWCTGWEEKANEHLPAALGLPGPLPYLSFDRPLSRTGTHWKLDAIDAYAGLSRPLAWIDDVFDQRCERWARERLGPTLLVRADPAVGLTGAHVEALIAWAASERAGSLE
jgi:hypothetical protein